MVRHICDFIPQKWFVIVSGENLSYAIEIIQDRFEYHYERFAIKSNKQALQFKRKPAYMLMALVLKPKSRKRAIDSNEVV